MEHRLTQLSNLRAIFDVEATGNNGGWQRDSGGSTGSSNTGPGTNNTQVFLFTETSGSSGFNTIRQNSELTILSEVMDNWVGTGRIFRVRASIAGNYLSSQPDEGLRISILRQGETDYEVLHLIRGWVYSATGFVAGGTLNDSAGESQDIVLNGGWVDYEIDIPDDAISLRLHNIVTGGQQFLHDVSLHTVEFRDGATVAGPDFGTETINNIVVNQNTAIPDTTLPEATDGVAPLTYSIITTLPQGIVFNPTTRVLSGTPTEVGNFVVTYQVEDSNNATDTIDFNISVRAVNQPATGSPVITGSRIQGEVLNSDVSNIMDGNGLNSVSYAYQWLRDGVVIAGATRDTYTTVPADVGEQISLRVTFTDDQNFNESLTGTNFGPIVADETPSLGTPNNLTLVLNELMTEVVLAEATNGNPPVTYALTLSPDIAGISFDEATRTISGTPTTATVSTATYRATDTDGDFTEVTFTIGVNGIATGVPVITGTVETGLTIEADISGIQDANGFGTVMYQWLRDHVEIAGATSRTYLIGNDDFGTMLSVRVNFTDNNGFLEEVVSAQTVTVIDTLEFANVPDLQGHPSIMVDVILPEAIGGLTPYMYSVDMLPTGLIFDSASRRVEGTPTTIQTVNVTYSVTDANGDTATAQFDFAIIAASPPDTITAITFKDTIDTNVQVEWEEPTSAQSILDYDIRWRIEGTEYWNKFSGIDTLGFVIPNLKETTRYEFQVRARSIIGVGVYSLTQVFVTGVDAVVRYLPLDYNGDTVQNWLDNLPLFYQDSQVMEDIFKAFEPEFELLADFVKTPDYISENLYRDYPSRRITRKPEGDISLDTGSSPSGLTTDGSTMWVADLTEDDILTYKLNGTKGDPFIIGVDDIFGITIYNGMMYILDNDASQIRVFDLEGVENTPIPYDTNVFGQALGITHNEQYLYVAFDETNIIQAYNFDGTKEDSENFHTGVSVNANMNFTGMGHRDNHIFCLYKNNNTAMVITFDQNRIKTDSLTIQLPPEITNPQGITVYEDTLWVTDNDQDKIFAFTIHNFMVGPEWQKTNKEILDEQYLYKNNMMGWGAERFVNQFFIIAANHFLTQYSQLYGTSYTEDYILLRSKLLFYSALNRVVNEFNIRLETDQLAEGVINSFIQYYNRYIVEIGLSISIADERYAIIARRLNDIIPAHLQLILTPDALTVDREPRGTLDDGNTYVIR